MILVVVETMVAKELGLKAGVIVKPIISTDD